MTDERSRYDGDAPAPPEPMVNTLPCDFCGGRSTHFSPHSKLPLCWLCAAQEEEEKASAVLVERGRDAGRDIYDLMERLRDRCYEWAAAVAERETTISAVDDPDGRKKQWDGIFDRAASERLAELVHRVRCNVTLSPWRGIDPLEVLRRMLEE